LAAVTEQTENVLKLLAKMIAVVETMSGGSNAVPNQSA